KIANRNYRVRDGWKLNSTEGRLRLRSRDKFCASSLKFESPDPCSSLCNLCVLCVSVVNDCLGKTTTEAQRTQRLHREIRDVINDKFRWDGRVEVLQPSAFGT